MEAFFSGKELSVHEVALGLQTLNNTVLKEKPAPNVADLWREHLRIRQVIEIATKAQKKFGDDENEELLNHPRTDADLKAFMKWADKQDIFHDHVDVARCPEGFGLKANKPIQRGETLVKVPRDAMLTSETARQSEMLAKAIAQPDIPLWQMDNVVLAVYICCQKFTHRSFWEPYIKMMPTNFDLPVYYTTEQLQYLKPSPLFEETLCLYRSLVRQFCIIFNDVYDVWKYSKIKNKQSHTPPVLLKTPLTVHNFNFDTYRWAVSCVTTRMNRIPRLDWHGIPLQGADRCIPALIPLLDFANHEYNPDYTEEVSVGYDDVELAGGIVAYRDFATDEVTPIFYGLRSNIDHLLHNGFVPDENPHDCYRLRLPIPWGDQYYEEKRQFFERIGYRGPSTHVYSIDVGMGERPIPPILLSLAKVIVSKCPNGEDYRTPELELKAVQFLKIRFMLLRRAYKIAEGTNDFERKIERIQRSEADILENAEEFCVGWEHELLAEAESRTAAAPEAEATKSAESPSK